jgi:hypothetical protein
MKIAFSGILIWKCPVCDWENVKNLDPKVSRFKLSEELEELTCIFCHTRFPTAIKGEDYEG